MLDADSVGDVSENKSWCKFNEDIRNVAYEWNTRWSNVKNLRMKINKKNIYQYFSKGVFSRWQAVGEETFVSDLF